MKMETSMNKFGLLLILSISSAAWAGTASIGTTLQTQGSAYRMNGTSRQPLQSGTPLFEGDELVTENASTAKILLGGNVAILLKPGSHFKIHQPNHQDWLVTLDSGAALSVVRNPKKRPAFFSVRSHGATLGVRGTTFFVQTKSERTLFLCTCHGSVSIAGDNSSKPELIVKTGHHESPKLITLNDAGSPAKIEEAPMGGDHDDADEADLVRLRDQSDLHNGHARTPGP